MTLLRCAAAFALGIVTVTTFAPLEAVRAATESEAIVPAAAPVQAAQTNRPLLVIRFNQRNVYFKTALTQAVQRAEQAKAGVIYSVVSYVPSDEGEQYARLDEASATNLRAVVNTMAGLGVPASRIQVNTLPLPAAGNQEIHVFVY